MCRSEPSISWFRPRAQLTARYASARSAWPRWYPPNGSTSANIVPQRSPDPAVVAGLRRHGIAVDRRPAVRRRSLRSRAVVRLKHRAAAVRELRRVVPQAGHDAVDVRDLITAQPPHIRGTGKLLLDRPAIFVRERAGLGGDAARHRGHKAKNSRSHSHTRRPIRVDGCCSNLLNECGPRTFAGTTNREEVPFSTG